MLHARTLAILAVMGLARPTFAAAEWELLDEDEDQDKGYALFSRSAKGSDIVEYRVIGVVKAAVEKVAEKAWQMATLPEHTPEDIRREVTCAVPDKCAVYLYYEMPVVSDRDVCQTLTRKTDGAGTRSVVWESMSDEARPSPKGVVRMPASEASWVLSPTEGGHTLAEYKNRSDPGGSIPKWIVNKMAKKIVIGELQKLRELAAK